MKTSYWIILFCSKTYTGISPLILSRSQSFHTRCLRCRVKQRSLRENYHSAPFCVEPCVLASIDEAAPYLLTKLDIRTISCAVNTGLQRDCQGGTLSPAIGRLLFSLLFLLTFGSVLNAQSKLTPQEAKSHIGETATVCGIVASTRFALSTKGQPTFLNLDRPYPNQIFTIVIWGSNRSKFGTPESDYNAKRICVTGAIREYRGAPEIVADSPKQIRLD